jgi:hypothetical protein
MATPWRLGGHPARAYRFGKMRCRRGLFVSVGEVFARDRLSLPRAGVPFFLAARLAEPLQNSNAASHRKARRAQRSAVSRSGHLLSPVRQRRTVDEIPKNGLSFGTSSPWMRRISCGRFAARRISARELLEASVARTDRLNPRLNAVVTRDLERAYASARLPHPRRERRPARWPAYDGEIRAGRRGSAPHPPASRARCAEPRRMQWLSGRKAASF